MNLAPSLLAEWNHETTLTRKMLEAVPEDKFTWKPHEKSMSLGYLANHLGYAIELFTKAIFDHDHYEWQGEKQIDAHSKAELIEQFNRAAALLAHKLEHVTEAELAVVWTFGPKEKPFAQMPRAAAIRAFIISHMIHHRGQLSVYLRLTGAKVPGIYGPSADEK